MPFDFDRIIERRGTNSAKWDGCQGVFGRDDLLPMWVADTDFAAPPGILEAIKGRADYGVLGYLNNGQAAIEAMASWLERRQGWRIRGEWARITPGVVPALSLAVSALTEPGDGVVIQPPVYPPFYSVVRDLGRRIIENPLRFEGGRYVMDLEGLAGLMDERVRMLILCSPHNPVGRVWERGELARLSDFCLSRDLLIVSDEIHSDLVFNGHPHIPIASISEETARRTITCLAPSKTFNVAGLETAAAIIPDPDLRKRFFDLYGRFHLGGGNTCGLAAMQEGYLRGEEWLDELLRYLEGNRDYLLSFLRERVPGVTAAVPEGTYLAWLDCRGLGLDADRLRSFLIDRARLGLNDGRDFGPQGGGFARLNFGCPRALLREGLERLEKAVAGLRS